MVSALRRLLRLIGGSRRYLLLAVALGVVQSALLAVIALLVKHLFDVAIPNGGTGPVLATSAAIVGLGALGGATGLAAQRVASRMSRTTVADLRKALLERFYGQSARWHSRRDPGVLLQTVVQDTDRLTLWLAQLSSSTLPALVRAIVLFGVALVLSPPLALCLAVAVPASLLIARVLGNRARHRYRAYIDAQIRFGSSARIALRTMELARVSGAQEWELDRHSRQVDGVLDHAAVFDDANARQIAAQQAVVGAGGVLTLAVGSLLVAQGHTSLGNLLGFYTLAILLLRQVSLAMTGLAIAAVNAEALIRIEEILDSEVATRGGGRRLDPFTGAFAFEGVDFAYDEAPVLHRVSFEVAAGEHVSLMGPSGSGKSTIVALLLGLYDPDSGRVLLDGVPSREVELVTYRRQVGVILQDEVVFDGTIRENIAYGRPEADAADVMLAAERAGLGEFIASLPLGLDQEIGDEGGLVSGGQRQRIGIARALFGEPALLVLDEPTSHLDAAAIEQLLGTLDEMSCTILTVTHDVDVAARADRVIHLRDGSITRQGALA